ncbi:MAG: LAGLIDADG family homing endonuclease, partial [Phenylobacterium sp.]
MTIKFTLPDKNTVQIKSSSASTSPVVKNGDGKKYANGQTVTYGLTKNSQWAGSAANAIYTQPMFFSPLHTPQNWQIASKRKEIYQWSFINPCYITCYDGSLKLISDFYNSDIPISSYITRINEDEVMVQDGHGNFCLPDRASKRFMKKQSNEIKVMGVAEPLIVTHDHKCMIIKREDIKCRKSKGNNKLCVSKNYSKTCKRHNCDDFDNKDYIISKIDARDVKKGDFVLVPFSTKIIDSVIENESQARYAGHLASDGWVCDGNNNSGYEVSGICYNQNEREYVIDCIDKVYNNFNIISNHEASNRSGTLLYKRTSNSLAVEFAKKLVKGKGSDKKFTDQVTLLDPNLQLYVLGAYIQSDGAFNNANQCIEITTYSKHLANQLLLMFFRCGILARVNKQPISISNLTFKTNNEYRYIINVPSSECFKIAEYVPGKLDNKIFKRCRDNKRFIWKNYVISAVTSNREFDYEGYVYDIRVPSTYTVTANGVGVHQSRFYYENEPKIAAGVDFYSIFPMNGFTLECKDKKVLKFFEHFANKIELNKICMLISHENHLIGDVFPFAEIQCDVCGGSGQKADGSPCNHPNGKIS